MDKISNSVNHGMLSKMWGGEQLLKQAWLYTFLLGFLAHGFALANLSVSYDALFNFYNTFAAHQHQIELGRVLEPLYREVTATKLLMPWSLGITAFFWLGLAVFFVCSLFRLSSRTEVLLTAGIMTVNISVTSLVAAFTPWFAADMFALLMAVLCAYFWHLYADSRRRGWLLWGMAAAIVSLSIYQCYLAVSVVLIVLLSIQDLVQEKGSAKVFRDGLASIGMIGAGGIVYFFIMKAACGLIGTSLVSGVHDSVTNLWDNQETIVRRMFFCLKEAATHFFAKDENIYPYPAVWCVNVLILCACLVLALRLVRQKKTAFDRKDWLLMLLLTAALPFASYMIRLLNTHVHDLMSYSVWLLYLVPLLLRRWTAKENERDGCYAGITVLLLLILFSYVQTDNAMHVKKTVESKATLSMMTEVMEQVDRTEGYVPGETALTFVGDITKTLQEMPSTERLKGISGCNKPTSIVDYTNYQAYFDNVMLRRAKVVPCGEAEKQAEVVKMPGYPQEGYVRKVGDTVVVKWN